MEVWDPDDEERNRALKLEAHSLRGVKFFMFAMPPHKPHWAERWYGAGSPLADAVKAFEDNNSPLTFVDLGVLPMRRIARAYQVPVQDHSTFGYTARISTDLLKDARFDMEKEILADVEREMAQRFSGRRIGADPIPGLDMVTPSEVKAFLSGRFAKEPALGKLDVGTVIDVKKGVLDVTFTVPLMTQIPIVSGEVNIRWDGLFPPIRGESPVTSLQFGALTSEDIQELRDPVVPCYPTVKERFPLPTRRATLMRASTIAIPFDGIRPETAVLADVPTKACVVHVSGNASVATLHVQEGDKADSARTPTAFFVMAGNYSAPGFIITDKHPGLGSIPDTAILEDGEPVPPPTYVKRIGKFTTDEGALFFVYERLSPA